MKARRAAVVGSGPNGLMAAVTLARRGWDVTVFEAAETVGGGLRSAELIEPGTTHDICSAVHPLALASPAFRNLGLERHGLEWIHPDASVAHPFDDHPAALLWRDVERTASEFGDDNDAYLETFTPLVERSDAVIDAVLTPRSFPRDPRAMARFAIPGAMSARRFAIRTFRTERARGLFAGIAAHSMLPLTAPGSAGYGLTLSILGHSVGWPIAKGGSQAIADALVAELDELGGVIVTDHRVANLNELADFDAKLLDVAPSQFLAMVDPSVSTQVPRGPRRLRASSYLKRLGRFRHGPGVFKIDWTLDDAIPWSDVNCAQSATVHLGGSLASITEAEAAVSRGGHPDRPYVILVQPSGFDASRAHDSKHVVWAYCHVPNGSAIDQTDAIESQVERFAPGFKRRIVGRNVMDSAAMQRHNANYVGGDINGGIGDLRGLLMRPTFGLHPWKTPLPGVFLCSASTPPGGGVHGMCGFLAADEVVRWASRS